MAPLAIAFAKLPLTPRVCAWTLTSRVAFSVAVEPTVVAISAPESIVATATPPEIPMTETPKIVVVADAVLSATELIVMSLAPEMLPLEVVVV